MLLLIYGTLFVVLMTGVAKSYTLYREQKASKTKKVEGLPKVERSKAAWHIINKFNELPEANRPPYDVYALVDALDTKHTISYVDGHFKNHSQWSVWTCNCRRPVGQSDKVRCPYRQYTETYEAIRAVQTELSRRERALEQKAKNDILEGLAPTLAQLEDFTTALKQEQQAIAQVTREYL
jgi:hypothetical protein